MTTTRLQHLLSTRDELDVNWAGELDDPRQQAVRAAWDATPEGQELQRLLHPPRPTRDPLPDSAADCEFGQDEYQWRLRQEGL